MSQKILTTVLRLAWVPVVVIVAAALYVRFKPAGGSDERPPTDIRLADALSVEFADGSSCTLPADSRVGFEAMSGSERSVLMGFASLPKGFCPQLKVRRVLVATGDEVRRQRRENKSAVTQAFRVAYLSRETAFTVQIGGEKCLVREHTQILVPADKWRASPPPPRLGIQMPEDVCPGLVGMDRLRDVAHDAVK